MHLYILSWKYCKIQATVKLIWQSVYYSGQDTVHLPSLLYAVLYSHARQKYY